MNRPPDRERALRLYQRHARNYDRTRGATARLRRRGVELLSLQPGQTVLDVGCGTGLSLPPLRDAVGAEGRVIGIELSPDMAAKARERIERRGWSNVDVVEAGAEEVRLSVVADAAFFFLTHDVMRSPLALQRTLSLVRDGGHVATFGAKLPPLWAFPLIPIVWLVGRPYVTTYEGIRRPWSHLSPLVGDLSVRSVLGGCAYYAWGTKRA